METATRESESEMKTFKLLTDILNSLGSDLNTTSARNKELLSSVMYRLANSQSSVLDSEIQSEYSVRKNHEILRAESSELVFLSKTNRNCVLVKTLLGFAKLEINSELQNLSPARLYALCTAYEAILSLKHSLVTSHGPCSDEERDAVQDDTQQTVGGHGGGAIWWKTHFIKIYNRNRVASAFPPEQ